MKVDDFDFALPDDLIATVPLSPRDSSRLLHVDKKGDVHDLTFRDILSLTKAGDIMVFNDTKVIPARLRGLRGEAKIEFTLHKKATINSWKAFAKPAKKAKIGDIITFPNDLSATVTDKGEGGEVTLSFNQSATALDNAIEAIGEIPLPPYIISKRKVENTDSTTYQTVYADELGAVAAPTAGLHYTPELLQALEANGVTCERITLHVGAGTFLPVKVDDTADHNMHSEYYTISEASAQRINAAKSAGGRVIAVGTTSLRALESATDEHGILQPMSHDTDIFITPGYQFKMVDVLQTNFHTPRSTLFMLVSAFCGQQPMRHAYTHAISQKYRFYSYGDACWLEQ